MNLHNNMGLLNNDKRLYSLKGEANKNIAVCFVTLHTNII
jgi:hypothetical protein